MIRWRFSRQLVVLIGLFIIAFAPISQGASKEYQPQFGQEGKDVVWLPTSQTLVDKMLDLAKLNSDDYLIDLGSGDGRTVITAAKRGTRALGIEFNPDLVDLSKGNAVKEGVADKARFIQGDLFESDFSQATVITMFLLEEINLKLRPRILNLKPGTRVVSNSFSMGDWIADETATVERKEDCQGIYCTALLWIVPAKVEGAWTLPQGELALKQNFQRISGTLTSGSNTLPLVGGKLLGEQITFSVGSARYVGRVAGGMMEGTVESEGRTGQWSASQVGRSLLSPFEKSRQ
jgi:hypothetical protein